MNKALETAQKLQHFAKYHLKRRVFDYPAPETAMGIESFDYDREEFSKDLLSYADRFDIRELSAMHYQSKAYPMYRVRTGTPDAKHRVLVLSAVHGNEYAGLYAVPKLLQDIVDNPDDYADAAVSIITPVNPVGAAHNSRYNGSGFDINRDFLRQETREARAVAEEVEAFAPQFVVSLHEGPQDAGAFIFTNRLVSTDAAHEVLRHMQQGGTDMAKKDYFGRTLKPRGYAPTGPIGAGLNFLWIKLLGMMTMAAYAEVNGLPEVTLETPWRSADRDGRINTHVQVIKGAVSSLRAGA